MNIDEFDIFKVINNKKIIAFYKPTPGHWKREQNEAAYFDSCIMKIICKQPDFGAKSSSFESNQLTLPMLWSNFSPDTSGFSENWTNLIHDPSGLPRNSSNQSMILAKTIWYWASSCFNSEIHISMFEISLNLFALKWSFQS